MLQRHLGITNLEDKIFRVIDQVLQGHGHFNNVFVLGEHDLPHLGRTNLGGVDHDDLIDEGRIPLQSRLVCAGVFPEPQHNGALLLVQLIEAHQRPDGNGARRDDAQQGTGHATAGIAATGTTAAAATEQAGKSLLQLLQGFIEIGRPLIIAAPRIAGSVVAAPGLIP